MTTDPNGECHDDDRPLTPDDPVCGLSRLGLFDGPAGLLLIGDGDGTADLLPALARRVLPATGPRLRPRSPRRHVDDTDAALASLGDDRESVINRLVLAPTPEHLAAASAAAGDDRSAAGGGRGSGLREWPVRRAAVSRRCRRRVRRARAHGARRPGARVQGLARRAAPAARRDAACRRGRARRCTRGCWACWPSTCTHTQGANETSLELYDEAIAAAEHTDLDELRAGLQLERGSLPTSWPTASATA